MFSSVSTKSSHCLYIHGYTANRKCFELIWHTLVFLKLFACCLVGRPVIEPVGTMLTTPHQHGSYIPEWTFGYGYVILFSTSIWRPLKIVSGYSCVLCILHALSSSLCVPLPPTCYQQVMAQRFSFFLLLKSEHKAQRN